ncbi:DUF4012 domain-containing protein [Curtobacterium sp. Leaf261]|uniref:DUF4012 domain-containing protein n=1 Tax=Curtobacterium sp. Leaf261 TaxID=1736311 RepID=UPI0006FC7773|nr:DUF4012 domain-containing protein [Curtobacterium sp. Leaf261]KQO62321.1 hypothetical protein ASF23_11020 [Curtobacterium sp. Leaf261]
MSDLPESGRSQSQSRTRTRPVLWAVLVLVLLVVAAVLWVGVRGAMAARDLKQSVALVSTVRTQITHGDTAAATSTVRQLRDRATSAEHLTSDPVWRMVEFVPLAGPNLRAVRQVAAVVADVSDNAVQPAVGVLDDVDVSQFRPTGGKIDLQPLVRAQKPVDRATRTLDRALQDASDIDTSGTVGAVNDAVGQLVATLTTTSRQAVVADKAVDLAPAMLGADGPKNYLLLFQNNAELRAGGGIPGAVAYVHAEDGSLQLQQQSSGAGIGMFDPSVLPLSTDTRGLYGDITGQYMQDVTLTPRFDLSAKLAREMWKRKYGQEVDGVLTLDPVTLGYILKATGPVTLPTGDTLTADNAASLLLSEAYAKYPDPTVQDAFFASAAGAVFTKVASGDFDPKAFIGALTTGVDERRVLLWSADPAEQRTISGTAIAGELPTSTDAESRFGVYLNDATGAKMDYYLTEQIAVGSQVCRADGRPTWTVDVTLQNTAPADAGTSLPEYVTGGGAFGVPPGQVQTNLLVYAPTSGVFLSATRDGQPAAPQTATDGKYPVVQLQTRLSPGESTTVRIQYLGPVRAAKSTVSVESTPGVHANVTKPLALSCE